MAPTSPNSPRAIRLATACEHGPIHTEMASKSNVKHTDTSLLAIAASSQSRTSLAARRSVPGSEPEPRRTSRRLPDRLRTSPLCVKRLLGSCERESPTPSSGLGLGAGRRVVSRPGVAWRKAGVRGVSRPRRRQRRSPVGLPGPLWAASPLVGRRCGVPTVVRKGRQGRTMPLAPRVAREIDRPRCWRSASRRAGSGQPRGSTHHDALRPWRSVSRPPRHLHRGHVHHRRLTSTTAVRCAHNGALNLATARSIEHRTVDLARYAGRRIARCLLVQAGIPALCPLAGRVKSARFRAAGVVLAKS